MIHDLETIIIFFNRMKFFSQGINWELLFKKKNETILFENPESKVIDSIKTLEAAIEIFQVLLDSRQIKISGQLTSYMFSLYQKCPKKKYLEGDFTIYFHHRLWNTCLKFLINTLWTMMQGYVPGNGLYGRTWTK